MPNNPKIVGSLIDKARELNSKNTSLCKASKILGVCRDTYKNWIIANNLPLPKQISIHKDKTDVFIKLCLEAIKNNEKIKLNDTIRKLSIHPDLAQKIIRENNLNDAIRTKVDAILEDKTLPLEEAQLRIPEEGSKVIGFKDGKYEIHTEDGYVYYKSSAKLCQGDPRDKCGTLPSIEYIESKLKKLGYTFIRESFTIKNRSIKAVHDKCGNIRSCRFYGFFIQGCPTCTNTGVSKTESELNEWVKSFGLHTEKFRFKSKTKGKEIDIYVPSLNLGIEYCGLHWHNEVNGKKDKDYHYNKTIKAKEQGIRLITIFEDEWFHRQFQVKSFLKSILNKSDVKIYARKCELKEVEKEAAKEFLNNYHISGKTVFEIAFGLYHENELVGLVTGNKHHRQGVEGNPFVLNRLVFKDGYLIVGGSSKLIKALSLYAKSHGYQRLISWSDNRWSEGNVYERCGFVLEENLRPDYSYVVKQGIRQSKQSNKKADLLEKLSAKGKTGTMENTELELATSLGYVRIWDCGKKRWVIKL